MKPQDLEALKIERKALADGWRKVRAILADDFLEPSAKLNLCIQVGDLHRATFGSDELLPPKLVAARHLLCERIPNAMKLAKVTAKDREAGQATMF